jgi:hypothetical protein
MLSEGQRFVIVDACMSAGLYRKGDTGTVKSVERAGYKVLMDSGKEAFVMADEVEALGDHVQPARADDAEVDYASELRDQFAAAALTGLLICKPMGPSEIARRSWELADAMLQARGQ